MTEAVYLNFGALLWGGVLGLFYFGGLWLTVRRLPETKHQALWMLGSFIFRNLLVAAGFYPVVLQGWRPALFFLAGFIVVRTVLSRRIKAPIKG